MGWIHNRSRGGSVLPAFVSKLSITTLSPLPGATSGAAYSTGLLASNGALPYVWSILSQTGSNGWTIVGSSLVGTPSVVETDSITIQVKDFNSAIAVKTFSLSVAAALTFTTASPLPVATVGAFYSQPLALTGGVPAYGATILSDTPDSGSWLSLSGLNLVGTPTTAETEALSIQGFDSGAPINHVTKAFSLTVNPAAAGSIKWSPGHWLLSFSQPLGAGETIAGRAYLQTEISAAIAAAPTVVGVKIFGDMAYYESTQGNYTTAINDITALCTRTKVTMQINLGVFNHGPEVPTDAGAIPNYILTDPTYGAALMGSSAFTPSAPFLYGYWVSANGAYNLNFVNSNANARVVALANGLSPLDAVANFEEIVICAYDDMLPDPGAGISEASYFAALQTILLAFKAAFPHTNICIQQAYGRTAGPTQNFAQWCTQNAILCGASDVMGASAWQPNAGLSFLTNGGAWASAPTGTSGTLHTIFVGNTGTYLLKFGSGTVVTANFTQGSTAVTWLPSVSAQDPNAGTVSWAPLNLQWGLMAQLGYPIVGDGYTNPVPALATLSTCTLDVQAGDMVSDATSQVWYTLFTALDIIQMANNFGNCSKLFWSYLTNSQTSQTSALWTTILPILQANALTNTGYPSIYPTGVPKVNPMGINFSAGGSGTTYYEGFPIFKNRVRESAGFGTATTGVPATLDANGWPNQNFDVTLWSQGSVGTTPSWVAGTWKGGFIGTGSETIAGYNGVVVTNIVHGTSGAYTTFDVTNVGPNGGFAVGNVTGSVTNVFCYLPEYPAATIDNPLSANAFTAEAIAHYSNYGWIRWMVWNNPINNNTVMTSSNRLTPSNTQAIFVNTNTGLVNNHSEGLPQEWAAAFCVACGCGMWLNLPNLYDASFTYITSLANALFALVPAGIPIYLEISDELWNGAGVGITAWNAAANAYPAGGQAFYANQLHSIASIFRGVFGARYGTDVRLVMAWQTQGNGVFWQQGLYALYATNGWAVNARNGGDLYNTAIAPYINLASPLNTWTIAQIEANLVSQIAANAFTSSAPNWWQLEQNAVMGLKHGLPQIEYEMGWQVNNESSSITNAGAAILDSGMTSVMNTYYQTLANMGVKGTSTFTGGVDSNDLGNLSPTDELTTHYPITTGNSPRFASIMNYVAGWTPSRNVVSASGSVISGGNYLDTSGASAPTLGQNGFSAPFDAPNYGTSGQVSYIVNCTKAGTYTLVANFTNSGSAGTSGLEYGGDANPFTVLAPTVTIPAGTNNVTLGSVTLVAGVNYVTIGHPGSQQGSITLHTLTFN